MNIQRLHELIDAWRDGELTEATAAELSQLLRDSEEARRVFRAEAQMHGLLHLAVMAEAVEKAARPASWRTHSAAAGEAHTSARPQGWPADFASSASITLKASPGEIPLP